MKKYINICTAIAILFSTLSITSCGSKTEEVKQDEHQEGEHHEDESTVELTDEQAKTVGITLGKIEMKSLSGAIKVNGMLDVPPQNLVSVSAPMGGFLKSTELLQGMKVTKGQVIAVLQNADYIQLQQDYVDNKSQLEFLEAEYKRQQELAKENVNSQKILLQSKTQYQSMLAKVSGLKSKLSLLGINTTQIESGNFQSTISLTAPISGYVTQVNVNIGMFVNPTDVMFKIVDTEHLHAELTVFEKDVPKLKIGQKVRFTLANETVERIATVYLIGREIGEDRTVRIHCHLDKEDGELLPGMYLKAYVEAGTQSLTAIPNDAIVVFEGANYVFVTIPSDEKGTQHFKMIQITKGVSELGYTEIQLPKDINTESSIVINGAFDILAKMKNSEEEGGHSH
ncbi:MAG: efflux RND transporter periplasmic adaptor subunit [Bacteroidetes bacterium]|jgi:cobalt-zinc-cadmium efflux system membrane fusion protein|nr:efflux RND transporter periplasmic adaptor subunit [Bacteroidota bacterium]